MFYPEEKLAVFIDGAHLYSLSKAYEFEVDFNNVHTFFATRSKLVRAFYYSPLIEKSDKGDNFTALKPLIDWLSYNGFTTVTRTYREDEQRVRTRTIVDLVVDMVEYSHSVDHIVLVGGDVNFITPVRAVKRNTCRLTLLSSIKSKAVFCSDDLRRLADDFIDVETLVEDWQRSD